MPNTCEPEYKDTPIPCSNCGALDQWKAEEVEKPFEDKIFKYGVITCTACGKADSGFFLGEVGESKKDA